MQGQASHQRSCRAQQARLRARGPEKGVRLSRPSVHPRGATRQACQPPCSAQAASRPGPTAFQKPLQQPAPAGLWTRPECWRCGGEWLGAAWQGQHAAACMSSEVGQALMHAGRLPGAFGRALGSC